MKYCCNSLRLLHIILIYEIYVRSSIRRILERKCIKNWKRMQNIIILILFSNAIVKNKRKINDHTYKMGNDFLYSRFEYILLIRIFIIFCLCLLGPWWKREITPYRLYLKLQKWHKIQNLYKTYISITQGWTQRITVLKFWHK